jgi:negative regulator of sigma-B (phosphoserine phosphatase)
MSLVAFDTRSSSLEWCGVGNVEGVLLRANAIPGRGRDAISCRGGVVGFRLPAIRVVSVSVSPGDLLVLATDGIRPDFADSIQQPDPPQAIADALLARCAKVSDDRLVLVARYLGTRQ